MSSSVGMTKTEKVTGKSAARHNAIKLGFCPATCKRLPTPVINDAPVGSIGNGSKSGWVNEDLFGKF